MDKTQADAIAQAILEPDLRAQEEIRLKRAREDADLARKRRVAVFVLIGSSIGAAIAYYLDYRFTLGIIWGGLAGSVVGWLITRRAA
ncbi:MAG: hypothetical protein CVV12_04760 [Gammaproteobacteria bacterium HGW-Gammaproteobacteria-2]|jgi:hypothetical protein|nr:MAG: hypothetical protein CVV12_04760 [Gammaproteobacteria bacterium HGW-Gammaproteobacteria-2]